MHVTVHIYASLRRYLTAAEKTIWEKNWDVPHDCSVNQVLERLNLPPKVPVTVLVNNNSINLETSLKEGDVIHILPQMYGG